MATEGYSVGFTLKSTFDNTGTQQAQKEIDATSKSANVMANALAKASAQAKTLGADSGIKTLAKDADNAGANSVKMSAGLRQGAASAAALAAALGQGNGGAGLAARSFGAILGGLASGPVGLVIAGVAAITAVLSYFKSKAKEAKEEFQNGVQEYQKLQGERIAAQYKRITEAIEAQAKAQRDLNASVAGYRAAETALGVAQIDRDTQAKVAGATGEQNREAEIQAGEIRKAEFLASRRKQDAELALAEATEDLASARKKESAAYTAWEQAQKTADRSEGEAKVANDAIAADMRKAYESAQTDRRAAEGKEVAAKKGVDVVTLEGSNSIALARQAQAEKEQSIADALALSEIQALENASIESEIADKKKEIKDTEKAILENKKAEAIASAKLAYETARRNNALTTKPEDFIADRNAKRDAKKDLVKAQEEAQKKADVLEAKQKRGVKLGDANRQWLIDFNDMKALQKQGRIQKLSDAELEAKKAQDTREKQLRKTEEMIDYLKQSLNVN